jgi:hypothetical protein
MTLDLIVWAPEAFVLLCLLVLLWYGSGTSVSPVIEGIYYLDTKSTVTTALNSTINQTAEKNITRRSAE